ncbi:hypothetical protein ACHAXR_001788, partial [Thalassiosira sp. AJA248-18]
MNEMASNTNTSAMSNLEDFSVGEYPCTSGRLFSSPAANAIGRHGSLPSQPHHNHQQQENPIVESFHTTINNIRQHLKNNGMMPKDNALPTFISGTLAFYATAFSSQFVQHKFLKMSTGTRPAILPISVGAMTVALGSWIGHLAGLGTAAAWGNIQDSWNENKLLHNVPKIGRVAMRSVDEMTYPMKLFAEDMSKSEKRERKEAWMHAARICILGLLTYNTIFRSHFSSLSPSSYTARGSFARIGIPAPPNFNYATRIQREKIERIGRWWGCHTCGSRMIFSNLKKNAPKFHGDHIPPVSVAKQINSRWYRRPFGWKVSQKFYPQCRNCSNKQGGLLSKAINAGHRNLHRVGGGEESYFHGRRLRIGHLTGGAVALLSIGNDESTTDGNEGELVKAS